MERKRTNLSDEQLLCIGTFCDALGIKQPTGRRWILERRIATVRVGPRLLRIPKSELERILNEGFRPARAH